MTETPQQYAQRLVTVLGERDPLDVLKQTPSKLIELVRSQPARALTDRPALGKWSVTEILAHLADAEMVVGFRVRLMLEHPGVPIQAFDQDAWAKLSHYDEIPVEESLQRFAAQRQANLRLLRSLTTEQLQQHGMHTERGCETVADTLRMLAGHDLNHLSQIEKIFGRLAAA